MDYTILYLKQDICLLADCIQSFRKLFDLDPCHFVSSPGLTWINGLYQSKIELDLLTNVDMYLIFERGIRGGVSSVMGDRYVKANNKHKNLEYETYMELDNYTFDKMVNEFEMKGFENCDFTNYTKTNYL